MMGVTVSKARGHVKEPAGKPTKRRHHETGPGQLARPHLPSPHIPSYSFTTMSRCSLPTCLAGVLWLLSHSAIGAPAPTNLTPHSVVGLRHVSAVAMAPDAQHVAYLLTVPRPAGSADDGEAWSELWMLDSTSDLPRPFVTGKVNVEALEWSPDSRSVAFLAKRTEDKSKSIYIIPVDGGEARRAVSLSTDITAYSFAPDFSRVAVIAADPESESRKKEQERGFKQEVYEEEWRPGRLRLTRAFSEAPPQVLAVEGAVQQVKWSPSGTHLAIAVTPTPAVDDGMVRQRVRVLRADDAAVLARIENPGKFRSMLWSPDSRHLALLAAGDPHDPAAGRLLVADLQDGPPREIWPGFEGEFVHAAWQGNEFLMFVAAQRMQTIFGKIPVSGATNELRVIIPAGQAIWGAFSLAADGKHGALVGQSPAHPAEVFTMNHGDSGPRRRTHHNPWLEQVKLARQEVLRYRARDGLELDGVLVHPLDEQPGRRYPLILAVHGGPEAHVSDGWITTYSQPGQLAAARGFAVFSPNYRGSTDRGVAFSKLGQGDAAGREFDDLVDGVDHLVALGLVDTKKVGITGGSYGGYATAWCSTRYSERFAAGVMFVGISDKVSKVGTTDIPDEEYQVHALKRPWEDWDFLLQRSPIRYAGNCRTPLLILHGKDDPRVNPGQSRELYRHLKLHGQAPVRLVLYPGEGHGNRKAAAQLDYILRMLQWFEHYLQGPGGEMPLPELNHAAPAETK